MKLLCDSKMCLIISQYISLEFSLIQSRGPESEVAKANPRLRKKVYRYS